MWMIRPLPKSWKWWTAPCRPHPTPMLLEGAGHPGPITPEVEAEGPAEVGVEVIEGGDMVALSLSVAISHLAFGKKLKIDVTVLL